MDAMAFRQEALRAQTRAAVEPQHLYYWRGYQDGLRRAHLGERTGSEAEHRYWLTVAYTRDASRAARGAGYRDGFAVVGRCASRSSITAP